MLSTFSENYHRPRAFEDPIYSLTSATVVSSSASPLFFSASPALHCRPLYPFLAPPQPSPHHGKPLPVQSSQASAIPPPPSLSEAAVAFVDALGALAVGGGCGIAAAAAATAAAPHPTTTATAHTALLSAWTAGVGCWHGCGGHPSHPPQPPCRGDGGDHPRRGRRVQPMSWSSVGGGCHRRAGRRRGCASGVGDGVWSGGG